MKVAQIKAKIRRDVKSAMDTAYANTVPMVERNMMSYYDGTEPVQYERTGTLPGAADVIPVSGGGTHYEYSAELDGGRIGYSTGTFSGSEVVQATVTGSYGVIGDSSYWSRIEDEVGEIVDAAFSAKFG